MIFLLEKGLTENEIAKLAEKLSELGVTISIDSYVAAGVLSLVSAALGAYLGSYLIKKGQEKAISEGFGDLKERLEQTTRLTEEIKSDIEKEGYEYKFKFEKYHERRIEVIERLYELLIKLEDNATQYIVTSDFGGGQSEAFRNAKSAIENFIAYSKLKKFWVPKDLYSEIEDLAVLLDKHVYSVLLRLGSKPVEKAGLDDIQASDEAIHTLKYKVPEAKEKIVENIRRQLDPTHS